MPSPSWYGLLTALVNVCYIGARLERPPVAGSQYQRHRPYHMQIRKLRDPERDMRYKALLAADELLSVPLGLAQSISAGVAEALTELLQVRSMVLEYGSEQRK